MSNSRTAITAWPLRMIVAALFFTTAVSAQKYDTLHLYYSNIAVQPHDTTLAKMDRWIKSLGGKHQDIRIVAYYHKFEFKKYAQERLDEMFLIVNRKARSLFTIGEMVAVKGKDFQRTTVDIIYTPSAGSAAASPKESAKSAGEPKAEKTKDAEVKSKKEEKSSDGKTAKSEEKTKSKKESTDSSKDKDKEAKASEKEEKKESKSKGEKGDNEDKGEAKKESKSKKDKGAKVKDTKTETWEAKPIE